jgi:hypothetical protein
MEIYRQGDVLLRRVEPAENIGKEKRRDGDLILAYGEVTGHAHRIKDETVREFTSEDRRFLEVMGISADVTHEEHATVTLPQGVYEVIQQREYQPGPVPSRAVAD